MGIKKKIDSEILKFHQAAAQNQTIEQKLEELIGLLQQSELDSDVARQYKEQLNRALDNAVVKDTRISPFRQLGEDESLSREELLDRMGQLLTEHQIDSNTTKQIERRGWLKLMMQLVIAIVIIVLGFAMIIMPAPQEFEIYTVFYFSPDDGVTIMDLVSLLIILCGIFLFIVSVNAFKKHSRNG